MAYSGNSSFNNTVASLQARGFDNDFSFINGQVVCLQSRLLLNRYEFRTLEMHFYPAEGRAANERMLYAIDVHEYAMKGLLVINGVGNNIQFLNMMNKKCEQQSTDTEVSIVWKYLTTEDFFY